MTANRARRLAVVGLLGFGIAACSDDGPIDPGEMALTTEEAESLMEALAEVGGSAFAFAGYGHAPQQDDVLGMFTIDESIPCPDGGSVHLSGSASGDEQTVHASFTQTFDSCAVTVPSDGTGWVLDATDGITTELVMTMSDTEFSVEGSDRGTFEWQTGDRSGHCSIDVGYSFGQSGETFHGTVSGTVCGHDISQSITVSD